LDAVAFLTNETVFDLRACPGHLIIIGGGPVGLELAQAFRRLGARVIVLDAARPLANDDPECAAVVLDQLAREGIEIRGDVTVAAVGPAGGGIEVTLAGGERIGGSHLLVATGRKPNVESLDLAAAGIAFAPSGITVDKGLRTSNPRVYAIGDVVGGLQFT